MILFWLLELPAEMLLSQKVQQYSSLLEVLALLRDKAQVEALPKSIETLRRKTHSYLPLSNVRILKIPLLAAKLLTAVRSSSATPMESLYWFDLVRLITTFIYSEKHLKTRYILGWHISSAPLKIHRIHKVGVGPFAPVLAYCRLRSYNQVILSSDFVC